MSDTESFASTSGDHTQPAQTAENTTMPFEPSPNAPAKKPKKKRVRLTPKQRAAKIAAGWNPPGPRPKTELEKGIDIISKIETAPITKRGPSDSDKLLKALVDKLVAIENDSQYRAVWSHYFTHGGVYIGPKYIDELNDAIAYLMKAKL